jgi:hypothetical protein
MRSALLLVELEYQLTRQRRLKKHKEAATEINRNSEVLDMGEIAAGPPRVAASFG